MNPADSQPPPPSAVPPPSRREFLRRTLEAGVALAATGSLGAWLWNRHPPGGFNGLGTSPFKIMRLRFNFGSGTGMADRSACVYGCSG